MSLLPSSPDLTPDSDPRVVDLDSEEADDLLAALSSSTARQLLTEITEEPAPPGELADRVDTSLQNAQYHLEKLENAGAIEVLGTAYSEKGREMRVYGPADDPLVIFAGEKERASGLRAALSQLFGGLAALAGGALIVQELFGASLFREEPAPEAAPVAEPDEEDDAEAFDAEPTPEMDTPAADPMPEPEAIDAFLEALFATGLPPGLAFFLGGTVVLVAVIALQYR